MLQSVEIKNFQSLKDVSLTLAPLTVIVGPSSSGKSAFIRAMHTLVNNRRGLDFLTHGETITSIKATTERGTVILRRGKATDDNDYTVIPTGAPHEQQRFTKLNGSVPEAVSDFLGLYPGPGPFAQQHDMPYMLKETGSTVASTLGKLTNVDVIFTAAREAKRQAQSASTTLRTRASDLEQIKATLPKYRDISSQLANLDSAEEMLREAYALQQTINRIEAARDTLTAAAGAVKRLRAAADISVPDVGEAERLSKALVRLSSTVDALRDAKTAVQASRAAQSMIDDEVAAIRAELTAELAQLETEFASRFEPHAQDESLIPIPVAATIAAQTVESLLS